MFSKVFSGHSFYHACRYIVNKPGAEVLEYEGIRGHNFRVMAEDFIMQQQMRPEKQKACFHCCLSFYPGEKTSDEQMTKIAKEYLEKMKIINTQYAITKHTDRKHLHLHIVANMVDNNGKAISDSYMGLRGKKISQQLTREYKLVQSLSKNLRLTNLEALHQSEAEKYKVYQVILQELPRCKRLEELQKRLQLHGIETQYKYKGQTQEKQGISFKIGEYCFKGSQVDRQFSLGNLEKSLVLNQKQSLQFTPQPWEMNKAFPSHSLKQTSPINTGPSENSLSKTAITCLEKIAESLLKPEVHHEETPEELLQENDPKKKKLSQKQRRGLHH